ncbi:SOS response-associated peptidase [Tropicimonas sp. IMCC34011]|uniref:SOS response-associated peptidase n=1 Tax=Tropicimonas sp. IMCC34011 TaxID=2248759 RepID=UPI000E25DE93|nr:SOS response-associated peptidase [Tropicimonas sp. IMCC34011]
MCGRFIITPPGPAIAEIFDAAPSNDLPPTPNYNVCPTDSIHTVTSEAGARRLRPMRWGFVPHWYKAPDGGPLLINARSETMAEKPAFRSACRERRCLVPASGFYEWTKEGEARLPWFIRRADDAPLVFAAIWQGWEGEAGAFDTVAIVTTAAAGEMTELHSRAPLVLGPEDWALWLGEAGHGAARLMRPAPEGTFIFHRVDPAVNSNRAEGPSLIEPIAA